MADTKISALGAVAGGLAAGDKIAIADASDLTASYSALMSDVKTYVNNAPVFAAGSASAGTWPLLTTGTLLTTAEAGAIEMADNTIYTTNEAGNRGVSPSIHFIRQQASRTLTSVTTEQKLFDSVTNGTLNLATGVYLFGGLFSLSGMSATSGNAAFDILGAGTATLGVTLYNGIGVDGLTATAASQTGSTMVSGQTPASACTAGTGTGMQFGMRGNFEITVAGTIIPSVTLVTAAAATVAAGSYFWCHRLGAAGVLSVGDWS